MIKHAYLITAYNNYYTLEKLIKLIDDQRNDIYIHIDKKIKNFDFNLFSSLCKCSGVTFVPRSKVNWGDYSQIESIIRLLEQSVIKNYRYYHLLSGADLPIKTQNYIHDFFAKNDGKEFVGFSNDFNQEWISRVHILNRYARSQKIQEKLVNYLLRKPFVKIQQSLNIDKTKGTKWDFRKGSDWFSISHSFAQYLLSKKETVKQLFKYAYIPTEFYVQTLIWNSKFKENIYNIEDEYSGSLRHIDWKRGNKGSPYVFRSNDFKEIINSDKLFARKFDENIDREIIDKIYLHLKKADFSTLMDNKRIKK